jgi:hypothetical protein
MGGGDALSENCVPQVTQMKRVIRSL